jgi:hypothetical protein
LDAARGFMVRRDPDTAGALEQLGLVPLSDDSLSSSDEGADLSQRFPEPSRRRFQVGLSAALVVAL